MILLKNIILKFKLINLLFQYIYIFRMNQLRFLKVVTSATVSEKFRNKRMDIHRK